MSSATSFADATRVKAIDSHTYEANLTEDWCIGSVPNGGYVTATFIQVATSHFASTLSKQNQPHTLALHMEFARRTEIGPGRFTVRDVKLGRQTSTIHMTLNQKGHDEVHCYLTQSDLNTVIGPTLSTGWELHPAPRPVDLGKLSGGQDAEWAEQTSMPFTKFRKASTRLRFHFPRKGNVAKNVTDQWIKFSSGEKFTMESLGFVCDSFPQIIDKMSSGADPYAIADANSADKGQPKSPAPQYWYPTVVLNLEIKKALPKEGVEWLFTRASTKQIRGGRLDLEVIIMDAEGDIVALSHHVNLVLDASRNLAQRNRGSGDSKM